MMAIMWQAEASLVASVLAPPQNRTAGDKKKARSTLLFNNRIVNRQISGVASVESEYLKKKSFYGIGYSAFFVCKGNKIGYLFDFLRGIAHCNSDCSRF